MVFGMAANPLDINNLPAEIDRGDQAEIVALDVKHHP